LTFYLAACAKTPAAIAPTHVADPLATLAADITSTIRTPGVARGIWGIFVYSLDRGEALFALDDRTLLVPASTIKLVSLAAAVDAVGWDFRYETVLRATGPVVDGVVQGDLIVVGSGDPSIGGRGGTELAAFVNVLKAAGIRRVEGRVIGDDNGIEEPRPQLAWAWDDLGYPTGAIFGALNADENRLDVVITAGPTEGTAASVSVMPRAAYRPLDNRVSTSAPGSAQLIWPEQKPGVPYLTIAGSIPAGAPPSRMLVSAGNPTFWFASLLRHELLVGGIEVVGEAFDIDDLIPAVDSESGSTLYIHTSPPLSEIARPMLKDSINLYGEAALRLSASASSTTNDSALEGLRRTLSAWGIEDDAWQVVDGSGLSRRNAVAATTLVAVLRRMWDPAGASPWMNSLAVAGVDGTLARRMSGTAAAGNVRAKTGTMSNIRSLAGYVRTKEGEPLAFAIMVNNFEGPGAAAVDAIDRIAVTLANFSRAP
jgi:D-alanyl-D-alanine carboxypeptidase/D-alanyl-D-alanine-endopeptidase (penicillin-binding protein 4)